MIKGQKYIYVLTEQKYLNVRIVHRSAKVFGSMDVELTQFANIDGERTKVNFLCFL